MLSVRKKYHSLYPTKRISPAIFPLYTIRVAGMNEAATAETNDAPTTQARICVYLCMYVCMFTCEYQACMYVCICVCMYVCIYVCMCVYLYVNIKHVCEGALRSDCDGSPTLFIHEHTMHTDIHHCSLSMGTEKALVFE